MDKNGWSPLHHAIDSTTFSCRAVQATWALIPLVPKEIINHQTTGNRPKGCSCLHLACDSSDRGYERRAIVQELIKAEADLELKDPKDNTPLLLASGCSLTDICRVLVDAGADVNVKNYLGKSCWQKPGGSSTDTQKVMRAAGAPKTYATGSGQTRTGVSRQRQARYIMSGMQGLHRTHALRTGSHTGSQHCAQGPGHQWQPQNQHRSKRSRQSR